MESIGNGWKEAEDFGTLSPLLQEIAEMADLEVLTIREVAELLKVSTKTVYKLAQSGQVPAFKVGGQWRVRRSDIDAWVEGQRRAMKDGQAE